MIEAAGQDFHAKTREKESWRSLLSCIRYREVLILQGPPLMGAAFSIGRWTVAGLFSIGILFCAGFLLVAHIWSLNDWVEFPAKRRGPLLGLSLALLVAGMALFACLGWSTFFIAADVALLGFFYSHPAINAKGSSLASSFTHLAGGLLHFLFGYSVFAAIDTKAVMIASFFALVFTAGHATQEVQDYDEDRPRGIRTNAVVFGRTTVFFAAFAMFTLAYGDLALLSLSGVLPGSLWLVAMVLFPLHCFYSLNALRTGLNPACVRRLRSCYRVFFILIGIAIASGLFWRDLYEMFAA